MRKLFVLAMLLAAGFNCYAQNPYFGAKYLNTVDSVFLVRAMNMEKQKDSEITNVIFYSHQERNQMINLNKFLKNPFAPNLNDVDYNVLQSAFDKYAQASKMEMLYDLDITAQPKQVLGYTVQPFRYNEPVIQYELNLPPVAEAHQYYTAVPFRPEQTNIFFNNFKETARTTGELRILFPETFKMFKYNDPAEAFPDFGNTIKKMFIDDLSNVYKNLVRYIDNYPANAIPDIETAILKERNITALKADDKYAAFKFTNEIIEKVLAGYNPVSLINYYDNKYYDPAVLTHPTKTFSDKMAIAWHGLDLIQWALRDTAAPHSHAANFWISWEQLNDFKGSEKRYFYALLYQKDPQYFNQLLKLSFPCPDYAIVNAMEPYVTGQMEQLMAIQQFINSSPDRNMNDNYRKYLELNIKLITANAFTPAEAKAYFTNLNDILTVYDNMHNQDYTTNVYYTLKILAELQQTKPEFGKEMHTIQKTAAFMMEVAALNTPEQLTEMLKKFVPKK